MRIIRPVCVTLGIIVALGTFFRMVLYFPEFEGSLTVYTALDLLAAGWFCGCAAYGWYKLSTKAASEALTALRSKPSPPPPSPPAASSARHR